MSQRLSQCQKFALEVEVMAGSGVVEQTPVPAASVPASRKGSICAHEIR